MERKEINQSERSRIRENATAEENIDSRSFFELTISNERYVKRLNFNEIRKENLVDFGGDFELIGSMLLGEIEQRTNFIFKYIDVFQGYINAIDVDYIYGDVIFIGRVL